MGTRQDSHFIESTTSNIYQVCNPQAFVNLHATLTDSGKYIEDAYRDLAYTLINCLPFDIFGPCTDFIQRERERR